MSIEYIREKYIEFYTLLRQEYYKELEDDGFTYLSDQADNSIFGAGNFINLLRSKKNIKALPWSEFKIYDEIDFMLQDIKYFIGMLAFLRPYVNNPSRERGTYEQTWEDHQYLRYSSIAYQALYGYWDRLGDLLFLYFETGLKDDQVYLPRVLNNIGQGNFGKTTAFLELSTLYKKMVDPVLEIRHSTVHHYLLKTQHYWNHTEHHLDLEQLKKDYTEKIGYWNELKEQFLHCLDGYKKTLALIKILPDK